MKTLKVAFMLCMMSVIAWAKPHIEGRLEPQENGTVLLQLKAMDAHLLRLLTPINPKLVHQIDPTTMVIEIPWGLPEFPGLLFQIDNEIHKIPELNIMELTNQPELGGPKP